MICGEYNHDNEQDISSVEKIQNVDEEWLQFVSKWDTGETCFNSNEEETDQSSDEETNSFSTKHIFHDSQCAPEPTPIYISTKSKIAYINEPIDLDIFWKIPVMPYATPTNGIIKKQIKLNSKTPEELSLIQDKIKHELYYEEHVIQHIDNPNGRIKFKDIRKISVGLSKKDLMSYRSKKKQAFYNCFVLILRLKVDDDFKEFHIKVFNTGKMEIPGVQNDQIFQTVVDTILSILQKYSKGPIHCKNQTDTVLINSNFNCGFYIERDVLINILKYKYGLQAIYDPCCSYPGIQCKFYYNPDAEIQTGRPPELCLHANPKHESDASNSENITSVSFMIFRTGSPRS